MRGRLAPALNAHLQEPLIAKVPVTAPDGRRLVIELRQGEQHDLVQFARDYCVAARLPLDLAGSIADAVAAKLAPVQFRQSVSGEGRVDVTVHMRRGEKAVQVVPSFCRRRGIDGGAQA